MKNKIMVGVMIAITTAMQGFAELSSAETASAITIDNTVPEPGMILLMLSASFIVICLRRPK